MSLAVKMRARADGAAQWWQARTEQERRMLTVGAAVVGLALVYGLLIDPALSGRARLRDELPQLRQQAAELKDLARQASELAAQPVVQPPRMTREALTASMAASGLPTQTLTMTGEYAKLQLKGVQFAALVAWLDTLRREQRIGVQDAVITAQPAAGIVDASLTLHQPAGGA